VSGFIVFLAFAWFTFGFVAGWELCDWIDKPNSADPEGES
jgi:hypothetical protein